ncbi:MAG TPA: CheR family methyltransferase [Candidatus Dormibacteraeota bacterium]|nr:CheR family methyltransferase [Candidatus Dormibacteraeota bacterium]
MTTAGTDAHFEALLDYLLQTHGFDFTGYKRSTLTRRVTKRVEELHLSGYESYLDHLQVHPEEFAVLFNTILINVTGFFRDAAAWEYLKSSVLPALVERKQGEPIRVWSAGCASGEEAYTVAMLLSEEMGVEAFRERVKIYATDIDDDALARARNGSYSMKELSGVPEHLRNEYFNSGGLRATFRSDLRRSIIFGRNDLVQDAPISRLDLLVARNTLMYFTTDTQSRILARFHYALSDSGLLFLGRAEMLLTHGNLFTPVNQKHRLFSKVPRLNLRDRLLVLAQAGGLDAGDNVSRVLRLRETAADALPLGQVIVDSDGVLVIANESARRSMDVNQADIGRHFHDLEISYRPAELRSRMEEARQKRRTVTIENVSRSRDGHSQHYDIVVTPLFDGDLQYLGTSISFVDVSGAQQLHDELTRSKQELETAYEELQSTNEELETTNEELQSTVEELETTNEELQSANEELETMNEELQSTNSELVAMNTELQERGDELDRANAFLDSVLADLNLGVVVVDPDLRVQAWNTRSFELWGVRPEEAIGESLLSLDIGLPVEDLVGPIRATLAGEQQHVERTLQAVNRRGRRITTKVTTAPLIGNGRSHGAVLIVEAKKSEDPSSAD